MIPMTIFDSNCFYIIQCLALVFLAAPCVLFAGGMLICGLMWCGLRITRALNLRLLGLPRCGRCRYWATVQCPLYGRNTPCDFCSWPSTTRYNNPAPAGQICRQSCTRPRRPLNPPTVAAWASTATPLCR